MLWWVVAIYLCYISFSPYLLDLFGLAGIFGYVDEGLCTVILGLLISRNIVSKKELLRTPIDLPILGLVCTIIVSGTYHGLNPIELMNYISTYVIKPFFLFYVITESGSKSSEKVLFFNKLIIIIAVVQLPMVFYQYLTAPHNVVSRCDFMGGFFGYPFRRGGRAGSTELGTFMGAAALYIICRIVVQGKEGNLPTKLGFSLFILFVSVMLINDAKRVLVSLVLVLIVLTIFVMNVRGHLNKYIHKIRKRIILSILGSLIMAAPLFYHFAYDSFRNYWVKNFGYELSISILVLSGRTTGFADLFQKSESPLEWVWGIGPGNYQTSISSKLGGEFSHLAQELGDLFRAHGIDVRTRTGWINTFLELGVLGLFFRILILLKLFRSIRSGGSFDAQYLSAKMSIIYLVFLLYFGPFFSHAVLWASVMLWCAGSMVASRNEAEANGKILCPQAVDI